ncbi:MAG: C4-dicarboxylate ABC transporter, partial [Colwellia sp.]|nr:C4-dicarboxylate ABC transporter [Colwellia sp.]
KGVTARTLPTPMLRELKALTDELMSEISAKDADFKKIYASQQAFSKEYKVWKQLGYLPRDF